MKLIMENWKKFLKEEETPEGFGDEEWAQSEKARQTVLAQDYEGQVEWDISQMEAKQYRMNQDVYDETDEEIIQAALGPQFYVARGMYDMQAPLANEEFSTFIEDPSEGPAGEIVVMPQKTIVDENGTRVHYFKTAHPPYKWGKLVS